MTIDYAKVKRILTSSEFALVESARPASIAAMRSSTLKSKINQARKQADKWSGQGIRQNRAAGKGANDANERTAQKSEVFKEVLARFEKQLVKTEAADSENAAKKAAAKSAKKAPAKPARKTPAKPKKSKVAAADAAKTPLKKGAPDPEAAKVPGRAATSAGKARVQNTRVQQSGLSTRTRGHVSARGRRAQAARNTR